jgi:nucleoside phosphorylase
MTGHTGILVVAATARELTAGDDWFSLECGVGPVEAAAATAAAIAGLRPAAVLNVGIAGVRAARQLAPGSLVIGTEARYCDLGVPAAWAPAIVAAAPALVAAARELLPYAPALPIGTTARVGASSGCDIEAMEGFGVLRAAQLAGVPAIEVRAISNRIEEPDRRRWHVDTAIAAIARLTPQLVAALHRSLQHA